MTADRLIIGMDYGTDSVRAMIIDAEKGTELANEVVAYKRWGQGKFCDAAKNMFRQHPQDYIDGMEAAVKGALSTLGKKAGSRVVGIGIDTTGSTPCAVDASGTPLALTKGFETNPNAMFVLWKDHTAVKEAELINKVARTWGGTDFTKYEGGVYSSEWFWSKILHVLREDRAVRAAAFSWVEHCDWMAALLTGTTDPLTMKRSRCAAGHKAMWHAEWGGLPPEEFLVKLDPVLKGLRARLFTETYTSDVKAGGLTDEWARRLGLTPGTAVAVGAFDAHMGGVGGLITDRTLVKIMGTSTCDMMVAPSRAIGTKNVAGICGQVDGSIIPGMIGLEAGQSAFGDVYAWFKDILAWPLGDAPRGAKGSAASFAKMKKEIEDGLLDRLAREAEKVNPEESTVLALDWLNGRRTPFADQTLKGAIVGLTLGTTVPKIFRALVEATAFGSRAIVEQFRREGVPISAVIALGGISRKSPFVMQVTADVLGMPIKVAASDQTVALGAGMFGAVAAGVYRTVAEAQKRMGSGFDMTFTPDRRRAALYNRLYEKYVSLASSLEGILRTL
ncbi:MAG TPA: ribulokinase [Spirochaetia bacterium]|nr:ribulokinase [Spirochaetia bacterium]